MDKHRAIPEELRGRGFPRFTAIFRDIQPGNNQRRRQTYRENHEHSPAPAARRRAARHSDPLHARRQVATKNAASLSKSAGEDTEFKTTYVRLTSPAAGPTSPCPSEDGCLGEAVLSADRRPGAAEPAGADPARLAP